MDGNNCLYDFADVMNGIVLITAICFYWGGNIFRLINITLLATIG